MRNLVALAVTCAAGSAAASPCVVNVAHASDEVKSAIEDWVAKETNCGGPLEVRVVPTDGGLYLFARDQRGRVRERLVPDATAAGVLVASWMADDSVAQPAIDVHVDVDVTATPPVEAPAPPTHESPPAVATMAVPVRGISPSLMVAGVLEGGGGGVRGELDLLRYGGWTLGIGAALEQGQMDFDAQAPNAAIFGGITTTEGKTFAYLARTIDSGKWELRPAVALVGQVTTAHISFADSPPIVMNQNLRQSFFAGELGFTFFRRVGNDWELGGGPLLGLTRQSIVVMEGETVETIRRPVEVMLELGVRRRL